ncbi:MAG: hypothetical protein ACLU0O_08855 [Collinsella sp.]
MLLAPYEGVVAAETGHVACHEAGAIEFGGHKVLTIPGYEGKMHAEDLENYIQVFYENESYEHTVFPGAVYVSLSTEVRHAVTPGRARGDSRGMPEARDSAVCGRCSPGLCAGGR